MKTLRQSTTNVIGLDGVRRERKLSYLSANQGNLREFFSQFVRGHFRIDFAIIHDVYIQQAAQVPEAAWDYQDLRQQVHDAIKEVYGPIIWEEICKERWFDRKWLSFDEVIERCTTEFILGEGRVANQ